MNVVSAAIDKTLRFWDVLVLPHIPVHVARTQIVYCHSRHITDTIMKLGRRSDIRNL